MLQKGKRRNSFRKKIIAYILFLAILGFIIFLINYLSIFGKPLFINPIGKTNIDAKKVEKILKDNNILFSQVYVLSDSSYGINIPNNGQIRFSSQKDIAKQVTSLQRILRELTIEGKQFKSIDFRFEEPIISF